MELVVSIMAIAFPALILLTGYVIRIEGRLTRMETRQEVYFTTLLQAGAKTLTAPIHLRRDDLIELLNRVNMGLSESEANELMEMMQVILDEPDERVEGERVMAGHYLAILKAQAAAPTTGKPLNPAP